MKDELDKKLVEKYPKIFADRHGNMKETAMCWGFDCNSGWYWLLDQLCGSIQSYIDNNNKWRGPEKQIEQVVATQVKEKWGTLNFYYYGGDDHIHGMVSMIESMSSSVCESCGSTEHIGRTSGWISYICKKCYESGDNENISKRDWVEIE